MSNKLDTLKQLGIKNSLISGKPLEEKEGFMAFAINGDDFKDKNNPLIKYITECYEGKR